MKLIQLLFVFVLCFLSTEAGCKVSSNKDGCEDCNKAPYNFTTVAAINAKYLELVPRIWSQNIPLSPLSRKCVQILIKTAKNEKNLEAPGFQTIGALITSLFFSNFIPFLDQEPDACAMAAIVKATVPFIENGDKSLIDGALTELQNKLFIALEGDLHIMMAKAGCRSCKYTIKRIMCEENGFDYPIEELWDLPAPINTVSPELKDVVLEMYDSDVFVDKFLASIVSMSLSQITQSVLVYWEPNIITELYELMLTDKIRPGCCYNRIKRAEEVIKGNNLASIVAFDAAKAVFA